MVFEYLKSQGLMPKIDEDNDIIFKYQMLTFIYFNNDDDEQFFRLALPGIFDVTDENSVTGPRNKCVCPSKSVMQHSTVTGCAASSTARILTFSPSIAAPQTASIERDAARSTPVSSRFRMMTSPAATGALTVTVRISFIASAMRSSGISAVVMTGRTL